MRCGRTRRRGRNARSGAARRRTPAKIPVTRPVLKPGIDFYAAARLATPNWPPQVWPPQWRRQMVVSANRLELLQIADAVAREKAIDKSIVIAAMADAIQKAARARY